MTKTDESFDTSGAAKTGAGPTSVVAIDQYFPSEQRIIQDDLAVQILPRGDRFFIKLMRIPLLRNWMIQLAEKEIKGVWSGFLCRKRYIDEKIVAAVENGSVEAIVNLGAGYDTRVYRLPELATVPVWEVDQPVSIETKRNGVINALGNVPSHVTLVTINFVTQDLGEVLQANGYASDKKAFFIWEAVSQYLTETAVRQTFDFLARAPLGSQLTFTYVLKDFIEGKNFYGQEKFYQRAVIKGKIWHFGFDPAEVADFLGEYGWRLVEDLSYEELGDRYMKPTGRDLPSMEIERMVYAEKV
jgi:methyltransferase (TIGR00027 family)